MGKPIEGGKRAARKDERAVLRVGLKRRTTRAGIGSVHRARFKCEGIRRA